MSTKIGELAEAKFVVKALEQDLLVSHADSKDCPYDKIVDNGQKIYRIQIKATSKLNEKMTGGNAYRFSVAKGSRNKKVYHKSEVDFFACYVAPMDTWYIIPFKKITSKSLQLFTHVKNSKGKYEQYKERWELLK